MLFAAGQRPTVEAIERAVSNLKDLSISHTPPSKAAGWVELLCEGLTFDCVGLSPATPVSIPKLHHFVDIPESKELMACEAISIEPGAHLSGADSSLPIVRTLMAIGVTLGAKLPDLLGFAWGPSKTAIGRDHFTRSVDAWLEGGIFPAPGLVSFKDCTGGWLESEGLGFFNGQELHLAPNLTENKDFGYRLAIVLVNQLVSGGPVTSPDQIVGPDGHPLRLEPVDNGQIVQISRG